MLASEALLKMVSGVQSLLSVGGSMSSAEVSKNDITVLSDVYMCYQVSVSLSGSGWVFEYVLRVVWSADVQNRGLKAFHLDRGWAC